MAEFRYAVHVSPFLDYFDFVWSPDAFEKKMMLLIVIAFDFNVEVTCKLLLQRVIKINNSWLCLKL